MIFLYMRKVWLLFSKSEMFSWWARNVWDTSDDGHIKVRKSVINYTLIIYKSELQCMHYFISNRYHPIGKRSYLFSRLRQPPLCVYFDAIHYFGLRETLLNKSVFITFRNPKYWIESTYISTICLSIWGLIVIHGIFLMFVYFARSCRIHEIRLLVCFRLNK